MTQVTVGDRVVGTSGHVYKVVATRTEPHASVRVARYGAHPAWYNVQSSPFYTVGALEAVTGVTGDAALPDVGTLPVRADVGKRAAMRSILTRVANGWRWADAVDGCNLRSDVPAWFAASARYRLNLEAGEPDAQHLRGIRQVDTRYADALMDEFAITHGQAADTKHSEAAGKLLEELQALVEARYSGDTELLEKLAEAHDMVVCCE